MARSFVMLVCLLAAMPNLKIGNVQPVELFLLSSLGLMLVVPAGRQIALRVPKPLWVLQKQYAVFLGLSALGALLALRLGLPSAEGVSVLKHAPVISLARITQLELDICAMLALGTLASSGEARVAFLARCIVAAGVLNALYGLLSFLTLTWLGAPASGEFAFFGAHSSFGAVRARGFFVEGGPWGVYLIGVLAVVFFRRYVLQDGGRFAFAGAVLILLAALMASWSKAALLTVAMISAIATWVKARAGRPRERASPLAVALVVGAVVILTVGSIRSFEGYWQDYQSLVILAITQPDKPEAVEGRLVAAFLAPQMIADHPLAGVGIGNYSLVRNTRPYLHDLPPAPNWEDLPGLGLLGYVPELGVPLALFLVYLLWRPVSLTRRLTGGSGLVTALAAYQLASHLFGTAITFAYPWTISALSLAYSLASNRPAVSAASRDRVVGAERCER